MAWISAKTDGQRHQEPEDGLGERRLEPREHPLLELEGRGDGVLDGREVGVRPPVEPGDDLPEHEQEDDDSRRSGGGLCAFADGLDDGVARVRRPFAVGYG
jgi:hypothetical protein